EHRERMLRDAFIGTTAERILRVVGRPVLIVHHSSLEPYNIVHIATDLSETSAKAARVARELGFLGERLSLVHVFQAVGKSKVRSAGGNVDEFVDAEAASAALRVAEFLKATGLAELEVEVILREGRVAEALLQVMQ